MLKTDGFRKGIVDEHGAILQTALNRDIDACTAALEQHLGFYHQHALDG